MQGILGQSQSISVLQRQFAAGRMHHGYIFHGPSGVGKFTTAVVLAKLLVCHQPQTTLTGEIEPCGECASCRLFQISEEDTDSSGPPSAASVAHPDLHVVTKELAHYADDPQTRARKLRTIPVEVIRQSLITPAYRAPTQGGGRYGKVFIVDEAELMAAAGQNALLKTLEEPPRVGGGTTIILVSANEERLLPTIRSRCQRIAFTRLDDETVSHWLDDYAKALPPTEGQTQEQNELGRANATLDEQTRNWLIRFAEGSLGRAKLALDYELTEGAWTILSAMEQMERGKPAGELGGHLASMISDFAQTWVERHAGASKEAANQLGAALCMGIIAGEARRKLAQSVEQVDKEDPVAGERAAGPWLSVIEALSSAEANLRSNVNLSLLCDHLALSIGQALTRRG